MQKTAQQLIIFIFQLPIFNLFRTFAADFKEIDCKDMGESCTASSLGIPQGGNAARVLGCSGAIQ